MWVLSVFSLKINVEPKHHPIERTIIFQTTNFWFQSLLFGGVRPLELEYNLQYVFFATPLHLEDHPS